MKADVETAAGIGSSCSGGGSMSASAGGVCGASSLVDSDDGARARHGEAVAALFRQVAGLAADAAAAAGGLGDVAGEHFGFFSCSEGVGGGGGRTRASGKRSHGDASLSRSLITSLSSFSL